MATDAQLLEWFHEIDDGYVRVDALRHVVSNATRELRAVLAEVLRHGEHEGDCLNYPEQDSAEHSSYDSCYLHLMASAARDEVARVVLAEYAGREGD